MTASPPPSPRLPTAPRVDEVACAETVARLRAHREPRALVVGNPNTGKSTLINAVAGTRLKVGNWSGVTVEKREAHLKRGEQTIHLLDLPGAYSLSPHTPEELITRTALLDEAPDVLLNVIDAGNLERNLYLTLQLLEFRVPLTIALNLVDEARNKGLEVDAGALSTALGVPVVETVGVKSLGTAGLLDATLSGAQIGAVLRYPDAIEAAAAELERRMTSVQTLPPHAHRYLALSLLEGDPSLRGRLSATGHTELLDAADAHRAALELAGFDPLIEIAEARYARAGDIARLAVPQAELKLTLTEKLDKLALHPLAGHSHFSGAGADGLPADLHGGGSLRGPDRRPLAGRGERLGGGAARLGTASERHRGGRDHSRRRHGAEFLADPAGAVSGHELSGRFRLHGPRRLPGRPQHARAGAGRTGLHSADPGLRLQRARRVRHPHPGAPVRPGAGQHDLAVHELLGPLAGLRDLLGGAVSARGRVDRVEHVRAGHGGGVCLCLGAAQDFPARRGQRRAAGIPALPLSRPGKSCGRTPRAAPPALPSGRAPPCWRRWPSCGCCCPFPPSAGRKFGEVAPAQSLFGRVSQAISPVFAPLGFGNWQATGALVPGFIAKEVVVGTLGQIYLGEEAKRAAPLGLVAGVEQTALSTWDAVKTSVQALPTLIALPSFGADSSAEQKTPLAAALARAFTPAAGLAYLVFVLLYTPCVATIGAMQAEHGRRVAWLTVAYEMGIAWVAGLIVYQIARHFL